MLIVPLLSFDDCVINSTFLIDNKATSTFKKDLEFLRFINIVEKCYEVGLSVCLSTVSLPVCALTHRNILGLSYNWYFYEVYYRMFGIQNEVCTMYCSFTGTRRWILLDYSLWKKNCLQWISIMLHWFKYIEINIRLWGALQEAYYYRIWCA